MSEDILGHVTDIFSDFDASIKRYDKICVTAKAKTNVLLKYFENTPRDFFAKTDFPLKLTDLDDEMGHAYYTVLAIEIAKASLSQSPPPSIQIPQKQETIPQVVVQSQQAPKGGGVWDYMIARKNTGDWIKFLRSQQNMENPQITTSKEAIDILEYGRQLIPEGINKVISYYSCARSQIFLFPDDATYKRLFDDLYEHTIKIVSITRVFAKCSAEYRKELTQDRKRDIGKWIIKMKEAEYQSLGGMRLSDLYRAQREAAGAQDAGA